MNVVLYGASGHAGSRILKELLSRAHRVTAVVLDTSKLHPEAGRVIKQDDLSNVDKIAEPIQGADAVVSAYAPPQDTTDALLGVTERLIEAVKQAGVLRSVQNDSA